jgi:hypothetical protein
VNEFGSLSTMLDELAPAIEPEEPAWDDVLMRAARLAASEPVEGLRRARSTRGRGRIAVLAVVAATAVAASALAAAGVNPLTALFDSWRSPATPGTLGGTYSTTLSGLTPASLNGRWTIKLGLYNNATNYAQGRYGDYVISQDGTVMERGTFQFGGSRFANFFLTDTGGPARCPDKTLYPAPYQVTYSSSALKLEPKRDTCIHRRIVLSAKLFTR